MNVGDIIEIKPRFQTLGDIAIVLEVFETTSFGEGGWVSFDYVIMTNKGEIYIISRDVAENIYPCSKAMAL